MKKLALFLFLITTITLSQAQNEVRKVKIEDVLKVIEQNDDTTRVINFWATWCGPCVKELPYFDQLNGELQNRKVKIILLAVEDELDKVVKFVAKKKINSQVLLLDEKNANNWVPQISPDWQGEIPVTLVINNAINRKDFHSGEMSKEEIVKLIEE